MSTDMKKCLGSLGVTYRDMNPDTQASPIQFLRMMDTFEFFNFLSFRKSSDIRQVVIYHAKRAEYRHSPADF